MNDEPKNKAMPAPKDNKVSRRRTALTLTCIKECVMPEIGEFHVGDKVVDEALADQLENHPYFVSEEK